MGGFLGIIVFLIIASVAAISRHMGEEGNWFRVLLLAGECFASGVVLEAIIARYGRREEPPKAPTAEKKEV